MASSVAALPREARGILLMLLAMLMFNLMDAATKFLAPLYAPAQIVWLRYLFTLPLALVFLRTAARPEHRTGRSARPLLQVARALVLVAEIAFVILAFRTLPLVDAHALFAATPLLVGVLSGPVLGERVGVHRWVAVVAGFLGVLVMLRPGLGVIGTGTIFAIVATALYALYQLQTRMAGRVDPPETTFLWQIVVGIVVLSAVGPFYWETPPVAHWAVIAAGALLGGLAHMLIIRSLSLVPAIVVQPITYTLLVWAVVVGYVVFGDLPDRWTVLGSLIVVAAGVYATVREHRQAPAGGAARVRGAGGTTA